MLNKRRNYYLIIILLILTALTACGFNEQNNSKPTSSIYGELNIEARHPKTESLVKQTTVANKLELTKAKEDHLNQIIIKFKTGQQQRDFLVINDYQVVDEIATLNAVVIEAKQELDQLIDKLNSLRQVEYAEANHMIYNTAQKFNVKPNDQLHHKQWGHQLGKLDKAWRKSTGAKGISVAVLDTGIDHTHPDLKNQVDTRRGFNFVDDNTEAFDKHGHGTHVAGIIGAETDNYEGISGTMWELNLIPVKVLNDSGGGSTSDVAKGILHASGFENPSINSEPVEIINLSLGTSIESQFLAEAVSKADEAGVIMVASSGNDGREAISYPAKYEEVIAVGAVDRFGGISDYSNYGRELDLVAAGGTREEGILSTYPEHDYLEMPGTSMAAPQVSGVIGLLLATGANKGQVRDLILKTALPIKEEAEEKNRYGAGILNAYWAVNQAKEIKILIGKSKGDQIDYIAKKRVSIGEEVYSLDRLPSGEYEVFAWLDVEDNGLLKAGDYLAQQEIKIETGQDHRIDFTLQKIE